MRTTIILMSIGLTVLSACGGVEREDAASNATSLSPPAVPSRSAASASSSVAPGQLDVDAFLRTDPEIVSRFGATPHGVRLACAFTPIVPRSDAHLYARFVCLEVMGTGPRAYSMSGSASSIALTIDPKLARPAVGASLGTGPRAPKTSRRCSLPMFLPRSGVPTPRRSTV